ncbi:MAG TPA: PDZ domain-containing protein [Actinomycetota bacterium]|nr:PDZ domain-containing protein [Actinomycetota bacterium]
MQQSEWEPPEPPGIAPVRGHSPWRWIATTTIITALLFAAFFIPIPALFEYLPGPAPNVQDLVQVTGGRTYSSEGEMFITTVSVDIDVTFAEWVVSAFDDQKTVVSREQVTGGQSLEQLQRSQELEMQDSNRQAEAVALGALGLGKPQGDGAKVVGTLADSPADEVLRKGDLIEAIDGEKVDTTCDVGRIIGTHEVGDTVTVRVKRGETHKEFEIGTIADENDPGAPIIGVAMRDVNYHFTPGVTVDFHPGNIAGPSAGLMFALSIYDQLTPDDLTAGRKIAGTGTIACDGGVGPIGGVEEKVAGAERSGAEIFLAPTADYDAARRVAGDIEVVEVSTFQDAVDYLEGLQ